MFQRRVLCLAVFVCGLLFLTGCGLPFREGILVDNIVFSDGSTSDQIGTGCKVQLYDEFIIVSLFPPGATNTTVSVYNWDQIMSLQLEELP